jgi:FdhD protein
MDKTLECKVILSGRVSLEMILKAAKMQIPIIISKSAPTSLSVALAKKLNITLVGFVRGRKMTIYANEQRIKY